MTKEEFYFDKAFATKGGLFKPESNVILNEAFVVKIRQVDKITIDFIRRTHLKLPRVNINYIDSLGLTVQAKKRGGKYYIGISLGMYLLIYDMFNKMLATKGVLTELIEDAQETIDKKNLSWRFDGDIVFDHTNESVRPENEFRREIAFHLFVLAIRYLVFHEFGHIGRGHLDYLDSKTGLSEWDESEKSDNGLIDKAISQALEIDADGFATLASFEMASPWFLNSSLLSEHTQIIYRSQNTFYKYWGFAIYSLLKLTSDSLPFNPEKARTKKHPPPYLRLFTSIVWLETYFNIRGLQDKERVQKVLTEGLYMAEHAFAEITHQPADIEGFRQNLNAGKTYIEEVILKRNEIDPLFSKHTFLEI